MKKLFCTICDSCRKLCEGPFKYEFLTKNGKILHFCSDECRKKHTRIKEVCLKCKSWTGNEKHGQYKCYTNECSAFIRDHKLK